MDFNNGRKYSVMTRSCVDAVSRKIVLHAWQQRSECMNEGEQWSTAHVMFADEKDTRKI